MAQREVTVGWSQVDTWLAEKAYPVPRESPRLAAPREQTSDVILGAQGEEPAEDQCRLPNTASVSSLRGRDCSEPALTLWGTGGRVLSVWT